MELYKLYHEEMQKRHTTRKLPPVYRDKIISSLYEQIQDREIWIPYGEVKKYVYRKTTKIVKSFKKKFVELTEEIEAEDTNK